MIQATLAEVTSLITDGTHASPVRTEVGIPVLSAQNVKGGRLLMGTSRFTSAEELAAFEKRVRPQAGDLLLTIVGTIGRVALLEESPSAVFQRSVAILRPREDKIDARYLLHATQSPSFVEQLRRATNQSSQAGVYLGKLGALTVPLPPLSEQRRIAGTLDQAGALCVKRRQALALLDELLPSVFLDMFGHEARRAVTTEPRTAHPRGWEWVLLSEVAELPLATRPTERGRTIGTARSRGFPFLKSAD